MKGWDLSPSISGSRRLGVNRAGWIGGGSGGHVKVEVEVSEGWAGMRCRIGNRGQGRMG